MQTMVDEGLLGMLLETLHTLLGHSAEYGSAASEEPGGAPLGGGAGAADPTCSVVAMVISRACPPEALAARIATKAKRTMTTVRAAMRALATCGGTSAAPRLAASKPRERDPMEVDEEDEDDDMAGGGSGGFDDADDRMGEAAEEVSMANGGVCGSGTSGDES